MDNKPIDDFRYTPNNFNIDLEVFHILVVSLVKSIRAGLHLNANLQLQL